MSCFACWNQGGLIMWAKQSAWVKQPAASALSQQMPYKYQSQTQSLFSHSTLPGHFSVVVIGANCEMQAHFSTSCAKQWKEGPSNWESVIRAILLCRWTRGFSSHWLESQSTNKKVSVFNQPLNCIIIQSIKSICWISMYRKLVIVLFSSITTGNLKRELLIDRLPDSSN